MMVSTCLLPFILMINVASSPDDLWSQWRGPDRTGHWTGQAWPESLTDASLSTLWRVDGLGPSYCGPVLSDALIFSAHTRDKAQEVVQAFDRTTGKLVWETSWEGSIEVPFFAAKNGSWMRATPAISDGHLYISGMRDVLVCLDAATGEVVWKFDFVEKFSAPPPEFGFVCSPLIVGDFVYVQAGASFCKLRKQTGELVWRTLEDRGGMFGSAFSSPIMATLDGVEQLVVLSRTHMNGVHPESGAVLWQREIKSFRGMNILTPVLHDGAILTAPYGGRCQLLDVSQDADGQWVVTPRWDNQLQGYMTSPVVIDGHAYFFNRSNRFCCTRLSDGEVCWISPPSGDNYWSLIAQDGRILALSDNGTLRLIDANPEKFEVIGESKVADDQTWAHLAIADGQIIVREQEALRVIEWAGGTR